MGSFAPLNGIGQQIGSAMGGTGQQQPPMQGGGGGFGFGGGMPAPMQNPFLGGQGMSAAQMNPQQYRAAPVPNADAWMREMGMPNDPGLTPYKLGQTLGGSSGGGMSQPMPAGWEPKLSSVNTTTEQDILRGRPGMTTPAPSMPPAPQGPYAGIPPEMLSKFFPTQFDKPTVLPTGTAYKPQNFGDFGFDKQMVDYLNNQRKMSATDAGIDYVYDPATQTFKGATMGGPVTKTLDQMRQAAAGYKPGMGGGMGQPFSPQVQVPPDMEKRLAMERTNMPYTPPSQIPISQEQIRAMLQGNPSGAVGGAQTLPFQPAQIPPGMAPPGTPQRPANPMLQRVAQQMQNRGKALPSGIAGLLNRARL